MYWDVHERIKVCLGNSENKRVISIRNNSQRKKIVSQRNHKVWGKGSTGDIM